jgi:hypothetical protein
MNDVQLSTGCGYGPVSITVPDTLDPYAAECNTEGECVVFAYAPNAGNPIDSANAQTVETLLPEGAWGIHRTFATPLRLYYVTITRDNRDTVREMWETLQDYPYLNDDTVEAMIYADVYDYVTGEAERADVSADAVMSWLSDNSPEPYYCDNGGVVVPDLEIALSSVRDTRIGKG